MACFPFYAELGKVCALITYAGNFYCETLLPTPIAARAGVPLSPEWHSGADRTGLDLAALPPAGISMQLVRSASESRNARHRP